jgi:hypothetical protein
MLEVTMKLRICNLNRMFLPTIAAVLLILAALACGPVTPSPEPSPTVPVPTEVPPTEEPTSEPTEPPTEPVPTEPAPTVAPTPPACPAPGSPTLVQPANFADYPVAIQQYLSAGGDVATLESTLAGWDAFSAGANQVVASDLTGDGIAEVAVPLRDPAGEVTFASSYFLILGCHAGGYTFGYQEFNEGLWIQSLQIVDANSDGRSDVAYTLDTCGAHTCFETLKILGWDGAAFVSLMGGVLDMPYPTYTVTPGRIEAQSGGIGSVGAEPQRGYTEIWEWNGSVLTITQQIWEPPVYRYHALLDGDQALLAEGYAAARDIYERVIVDDGLQEWGAVSGVVDPADERAQLTAFARWRLLLTYLLTGDLGGAQSEYDRLQADYPAGSAGHDVAVMAETFWIAYQVDGSIADGCAEVVAAAEVDTAVQDFFNWNYGYANPWWESLDLCPFVE